MKLGSIQFLRATAAILVVYAYSISLSMDFVQVEESHYFSGIGFIGQDLFFVISGFIITYTGSKYNGLDDGILFLQRRFIRTIPLYYIASLLYSCCNILYIWYTKGTLPMPISMLLTSLADTLLVVPTASDMSEYRPLLHSGWALAFGWLFYLLVFITIIVKKNKTILLSLILVLLSIAGYITKPQDLRLSFLANPILFEFLLGTILCKYYLSSIKLPIYVMYGFVLGSIAWCIFLVFNGYGIIHVSNVILLGTESLKRALFWGLPACILLTGCLFLEKQGKLSRFWNNRIVQQIGDASFSIYLIHLPIFALLSLLYRKTNFRLPGDVGILFQVMIALVIGIVFYRLVEQPLLKSLSKLWAHKRISNTSPQASTL